ncbi:MAG: 1,4-dihydroxy-6-naphthoate synthase [Mucilaginibacter polytrichastri]|nr:1,4-dihydroxy-6-naphthoate synthase [Mucilaginibacter polytrichastri]
MKLTLGFSPCPNDTFIFDALIHKKIDTGDLEFDVVYDDVETLNQKAFRGELDITKLSYHAMAYAFNDYQLLDSGSALGFGVGPLLISNASYANSPGGIEKIKSQIAGLRIGIPGKYTTANFLLSLAFPEAKNKVEIVFSDIEDAILRGETDLGLIIHENRFTYQQKGLHKVLDLGDFWEKETGAAIPLGGICVKRSLPDELKRRVNRLIRESVEFAFANPGSSRDFVREHAQAMDEEVMYKHIELYVNAFSVDLGPEGRAAVSQLFKKAGEKNIIPPISQPVFLT